MNRMNVPTLLKIFVILCISLLIVPFSHAENKIKKVRVTTPEGFVLNKVGSHYVPVEKDYKSFLLPGTHIRGDYSATTKKDSILDVSVFY